MLRVTGHPGIRIAAPPFYSTAVAVKWVLSFDGSHGSGETRTRTGDTMIFRHVPLSTVERRWLPLGAPKLKSGRSRRRRTSENAGSGHGVVVAVVVLTGEVLTKPV